MKEHKILALFKEVLKQIGAGEYCVFMHTVGDEKYALEKNEVMSVELLYPYRTIHFSVSPKAMKWYEQGKNFELMTSLYHEAFHIWFWRYKELVAKGDEEGYENEEEELADKFSFLMYELCK